jgi:hypothetical protein
MQFVPSRSTSFGFVHQVDVSPCLAIPSARASPVVLLSSCRIRERAQSGLWARLETDRIRGDRCGRGDRRSRHLCGQPRRVRSHGTALVQEQLPAADQSIVRIEILGSEFLYAIRLRLLPGSFNLCPADYCELPGIADGVSGRGLPIERYGPPGDLIEDARRIVAAAGIELGGVEHLVNERDGLPYFYDVNALSNFVAKAPELIGFDPFVDLVDFLLERAGTRVAIAR